MKIKIALVIVLLVTLFYMLVAICLMSNKVNETLKLVQEVNNYCLEE